MKITKKQLRIILREALEKVDWDNTDDMSWGPNDQTNWEREQDISREDQSKAHPGYTDDVLSRLDDVLMEAIEALGSSAEVKKYILEKLK